ncbi:hypothetical protein [Alkalihalobacillus sp. 1P02AB]|uniref:hypothetical protein n=1 Tax=Alkalihalobacillus sp. 1P02AB TaxID=3132260 RepID=UPI0039A46471
MKAISIILIVIGVIGLLLSTLMFGDIGLLAAFASTVAILSGIGFWMIVKQLNEKK